MFKADDGREMLGIEAVPNVLPRNAIFYNFELAAPLLPQTPFPEAVQREFQRKFVQLYRPYQVWDYSWWVASLFSSHFYARFARQDYV